MTFDDPRLLDLADVIAEGGPVAWRAFESHASDSTERRLIHQFQTLSRLAALHRGRAYPLLARPHDSPPPDATALNSSELSTTTHTAAYGVWHWGPFEVREQIGAGGFGAVYRAWDPALQTHVALKLLNTQVSDPADTESALLKEAQRLAQVRHANVIVVHGADRHRGIVGFWMELVKGQTLEVVVRQRGVFGAREAGLVGIDMCQALAAVHRCGLVHGDLKARNVMREDGGRHVLMDFGAALELRAIAGRTAISIVGTPLYMAPEVLAGHAPTPRADIYSLGVLLYHLVSSEYPVSGRSAADILTAHGRGERRWLRDARPDLPQAFIQAVERALVVDPVSRFESAGAMEAALEETLSHGFSLLSRGARPPTADAPQGADQPRGIHRRIVLGTLSGLVVAGLLVAGPPASRWLNRRASIDPGVTIRTLAVLPFENLGDQDQEYFSDGVTELLNTTLSELSSLRVISRTSAMQYRHSQKSLPEIARELHADAVVEGSVLRSGDRVRVTAKLVHAGTDTLLWGDTLERTVGDLFDLQNELVRSIAKRIRVTVTPLEEQRLSAAPRIVPAAQEEYLRGWAALTQMTADGAREAVNRFESAVRLDPTYARAYAGLSHAYWYLGAGLGLISREDGFTHARDAALQALRLDSDLPRAHAALAQVKFYYEWDWAGAEREFQRAVDLNPSDADAHQQYGWYLAARGRLAEALAQMVHAREADPLSTVRRSPLAAVLYYSRRYDEAIQELRAALAENPNSVAVHAGLARAYAGQKRFDDAIKELQWPAFANRALARLELARVYAEAGDRERALRTIREARLLAAQAAEVVPPEAAATVYVALNDRARAFQELDVAFEQRSLGLVWLKVDPRFDAIREDSRFVAMLGRMGL